MKVWITKYALTAGIEEREVELCSDISDKMVADRKPGRMTLCFHKPDWHTSLDDARKQAVKMVANKIKSLKKQLDKLHELAKHYEVKA